MGKSRCVVITALLGLALAAAVTLQAAVSVRCQQVNDCTVTESCTWVDNTWPYENVCVNVVLDLPDECKYTGESYWTCTDTTTTRRCASTYWNYIGSTTGSSYCSSPPTPPPGCGTEALQYQSGRFVPDTCTETFKY